MVGAELTQIFEFTFVNRRSIGTKTTDITNQRGRAQNLFSASALCAISHTQMYRKQLS